MAVAAIFIGFVNFFWFITESQSIGGDALNGSVVGGRYFVSSHGSETEVDEETWYRSRLHAMSLSLTHPLAMAGMVYLMFAIIFPALMTQFGQSVDPAAERQVLESGAPIASGECSGRIGLIRSSVAVTVHPGGIRIKPMFTAPIVVSREEIVALRPSWALFGGGVEIVHHASRVDSPIVLYCGRSSPLATALNSVVSGDVRA